MRIHDIGPECRLRSTATSLLIGLLVFLLALPFWGSDLFARTPDTAQPAAMDDSDAEAGEEGISDERRLSAEELEELVGPIALYPDDLLAQVLPASTYPLDVVEAARFLAENEGATEPPEDSAWEPSVIALLSFPEVIEKMSDDISWTRRLGDALWTQEEDVYDAIQAFRLRVAATGNLESNDKVVVVREKETIKIVPADPQVIYVPVYQPQTVVVRQTTYVDPVVVWGTAVVFTAAWAYTLYWGHHHHHRVHYHRHYHSHYHHYHYKKHKKHYKSHGGKGGSWKPSHRPGGGRPGHGGGSKPGRPGHPGGGRPGSGWGKPGRPGGEVGRPGRPGGEVGRPGRPGGEVGRPGRPGGGEVGRPGTGPSARPGSRPSPSQGSYGRYDRGNTARANSARGGQSRQRQTIQGSRQRSSVSSGRSAGSRGGSYGRYGSGASASRSSSRGAASRGSGRGRR